MPGPQEWDPTAPGAVYGPGAPPPTSQDEMDRLLRIRNELDKAELDRREARLKALARQRQEDPQLGYLREFEASVQREMSRSPEVAKAGLCRAEHPGRRRGDRIVECGLNKGHEPPEEHEEAETGIRWIAYPPGTHNPLSFSPRAEAMQWDGSEESMLAIHSWLGDALHAQVVSWREAGQGIGQSLGGPPTAGFRVTKLDWAAGEARGSVNYRLREGWWLVICLGRPWVMEKL